MMKWDKKAVTMAASTQSQKTSSVVATAFYEDMELFQALSNLTMWQDWLDEKKPFRQQTTHFLMLSHA